MARQMWQQIKSFIPCSSWRVTLSRPQPGPLYKGVGEPSVFSSSWSTEGERENHRFPKNLQRPSDVLTHSVHPQKVSGFFFPPSLFFLEQKKILILKITNISSTRGQPTSPVSPSLFQRIHLQRRVIFVEGGDNVSAPDADTGPFISPAESPTLR